MGYLYKTLSICSKWSWITLGEVKAMQDQEPKINIKRGGFGSLRQSSLFLSLSLSHTHIWVEHRKERLNAKQTNSSSCTLY